MSEPTYAVTFAAKSTEDKHGSIPTQQADSRALAEREGYEVVAEFKDESASAYSGDRGPNLAAALAECERLVAEHGEAVLIVQHSDRLARGDGKQAKHLVEYALWAIKAGVKIRSVQDDQTFGDLLYSVVTGQRNHEDSARKSKATKDGLKRRKERGSPVGPIPLGYTVETQVVDGNVITTRVVDPATATIIERICDLKEAGSSPGRVARMLNAEGLTSKRGKPFTARIIREILMNDAYAGRKGYPQIIEPERWQRIQDGMKRLDPAAVKKRQGGRPPKDESYILRGVAFCLDCGGTLYARHMAAGRTYVCRNRRENTGLCSAPPIPAGMIEGHVLRHLDVFIGGVEEWIVDRLDERDGARQQREAALDRERAMVADIERQREQHMNQYRTLIAEGSSLARIALEEVERIDQQITEQQRTIEHAEAILSEWAGPPDMDAALDYYNGLVELVRGQVDHAQGCADLNRTLHRILAGLWASVDGDTLRAEFQLRVTEGGVTPLDGLRQVLTKDLGGDRMKLPQDAPEPAVFDLDSITLTPELDCELRESDDPVALLHEIEAEQKRSGIPGPLPR